MTDSTNQKAMSRTNSRKAYLVILYKEDGKTCKQYARRLIKHRGNVKIYECRDRSVMRLVRGPDDLYVKITTATKLIECYCPNYVPLNTVFKTTYANVLSLRGEECITVSTMYQGRSAFTFAQTYRDCVVRKSLIIQMLIPLVALHQHNLLHCDVKIDNYVVANAADAYRWPPTTRIPYGTGSLTLKHQIGSAFVLPMLIDFDTLNQGEVPLSVQLHGTVGNRAPEHYFVARGHDPPYSVYSEAFSFGMLVLSATLPPSMSLYDSRFAAPKEFVESAAGCMERWDQYSDVMHEAYSSDNNKDLVADYAWRTALAIGFPEGEDEWVLETPLGRVLNRYKDQLVGAYFYRWPTKMEFMHKNPACLDMVKKVLRWTPERRETCTELLECEYFAELRSDYPPNRCWAPILRKESFETERLN